MKKEDESLESKISANESMQEIRITVKLISKNQADLVEQIINGNDGSIVGIPDDRGKYEENPSKLYILKSNIAALIFSWISVTTYWLFTNNELIALFNDSDDININSNACYCCSLWNNI